MEPSPSLSDGHHASSFFHFSTVLIVASLLFAAVTIYFFVKIFYPSMTPSPTACTMEAKLCPDGSSVGRAGPNCEFAACSDDLSSPPDITAAWQTYTDSANSFEFKYPEFLTVIQQQGIITLTNNLSVLFHTQAPSEINIINFKFTVEEKNGSFEDIVSYEILNPKDMSETHGNHIFRTAFTGSEGTGVFTYFLQPSADRWIVFNHHLYLDADVELVDRNKSGYLTNQQQKQLISQILSTFKFINAN